MAWTETDRDKIKAALALGASRVKVGERDTTLRSVAEMERVLKLIEDDLALQLNPIPRAKVYRMATTKGIR